MSDNLLKLVVIFLLVFLNFPFTYSRNIDFVNENIQKESDCSENTLKGSKVVYLTPNFVNGKNVLTQEMLSKANTCYVIRYDYDLLNTEVIIPKGCTLDFKGGSLTNGIIVGDDTVVYGGNYEIFKHGQTKYHKYVLNGSKNEIMKSDGIIVVGTWNNKICHSNWTGLLNINEYIDAYLPIQNFINLHKSKTIVNVPKNKYCFYRTIQCSNKSIDFNNSFLQLIEYKYVEDLNISIPFGAQSIKLNHPGDLFQLYGGNNIFARNLILDGRFGDKYQELEEKLGTKHGVRISLGKNISLENVVLQNHIGCGVASNNNVSDVTFRKVVFKNIAEHGIYTHQREGFLKFEDCQFVNCSYSYDVYKMGGSNGRISACIRNSTKTDKDLSNRSIKVYCYNTIFHRDNDCISFTPISALNDNYVKCLTNYDGGTYYEYHNCEWSGNMLGVSGTDIAMHLALNKPIYHIFHQCINPPNVYSGYDILLKYFNCDNVVNLFSAVEAENCNCVIGYSDTYNRFNSTFINTIYKKIIAKYTNCNFITKDDFSVNRMRIYNPFAKIELINCEFNIYDNSYSNKYVIGYAYSSDVYKNAIPEREFIAFNCIFNLLNARFANLGDNLNIKLSNNTIYEYNKSNGIKRIFMLTNNSYYQLIHNTIKVNNQYPIVYGVNNVLIDSNLSNKRNKSGNATFL